MNQIDWDKMVFPDGNEEVSGPQSMEQELYNLVKGGHDAVLHKASEVDPSQARRGLEMAWQMQESQEECVRVHVLCDEETDSISQSAMSRASPTSDMTILSHHHVLPLRRRLKNQSLVRSNVIHVKERE